MDGSSVNFNRVAPGISAGSAVAALFIDEYDRDLPRVAIPRPAVQVVVRFGPVARDGLDVHAFGVQQRVRRKFIRAGQRAVMASLHPGVAKAVLGVPADAIAGRVLDLDELWGNAATRRLLDQLATARTTIEAARMLESAITARAAAVDQTNAGPSLAQEAAVRLASANVSTVADDLGVSERHLRRVFSDAVGVSPKVYARLMRFDRALRAARADSAASWASIAAATGYYDQAHLIGEFQAISGVTPCALLCELRAG
jgi:AraC-like DNA-binding protein